MEFFYIFSGCSYFRCGGAQLYVDYTFSLAVFIACGKICARRVHDTPFMSSMAAVEA